MALNATDAGIGDILVRQKLLTLAELDAATDEATDWNVRLADVLLAHCVVKPADFYRAAARQFDLPYVDLAVHPADDELFETYLVDEYIRRQTIPWRTRDGRLIVATADPGAETVLFARQAFGQDIDFVVASRGDIQAQLQRIFRDMHSTQAVHELARTDPDMSASRTVTPVQLVLLFLAGSALLAGFAFEPIATLIVINAAMTVFYLGNFVFKGLLVWVGGRTPLRFSRVLEIEARLLREDELPVYTILVPMFREPEVLPILASALRQLDYPLAKLDIKLVLEEGDTDTIEASRLLDLEGVFETIIVPPSQPQSKPKACNYALKFVRGELITIYDAEDKPEREQLRKVVAAFQDAPPETACVQCRLNYYNVRENWLTRMFTLDYALWFDLMLPGLERLGLPIPLGGSSNHFKTSVLRELHGWDPFNVTEDADLGIRLTQKGYRVRVIDSTTYEEANCDTGNWIRQRSRWVKGYMQTFLVHSRRPVHFVRHQGVLPALGLMLFIGGTMLSGLLNPVFWAIFILWMLNIATGLDAAFPPLLVGLALGNLLMGNGMFIYLSMIAPFQRGWLDLTPYGMTVFWYWVLTSIAAFKGFWQLMFKPFYWEKTQHGISRFTAAEVARARPSRRTRLAAR